MLPDMCRLENILIAVEEKMAGSQSAVAVEAAGGILVVAAGEEMADSQSAVAVEAAGGRLAVVAGGKLMAESSQQSLQWVENLQAASIRANKRGQSAGRAWNMGLCGSSGESSAQTYSADSLLAFKTVLDRIVLHLVDPSPLEAFNAQIQFECSLFRRSG
jgi:urease accessory protein UreF